VFDGNEQVQVALSAAYLITMEAAFEPRLPFLHSEAMPKELRSPRAQAVSPSFTSLQPVLRTPFGWVIPLGLHLLPSPVARVAEVVVFNNPIPQNTGDEEMTQHADIYERITAVIIEAIEAGCGKFEMPWHTFGVVPSNANTHRRYRGLNTLVLWAAAGKHGYKTNLWATYQQWSELGAQVRKGAKSTTVVFWKFYGEEREADDTSAEESKDETRSRCFARAYSVFNADQVDGFVMPEVPQLPEAERIERAEQFFRQTGIKIIEKGGRACYNVATDEIHMPPFSLFKKSDYFYSTLSHEAVHASGHPTRCNRQLGNRFGSKMYAAEELCAELGSAFLSAELELETEPRADNAPYVANWLKILKDDTRAIFTAASQAQKAVDLLLQAAASAERAA
jgi:antirestriction protein ArdC